MKSKTYLLLVLLCILLSCARTSKAIKKKSRKITTQKKILSREKADVFFRQGQYSKALREYDKFIANAKDDYRIPIAHFNAGVILLRKKIYSRALEHFEVIYKNYPSFEKDMQLRKYIADCYFIGFDYHKAIFYYTALFQKYPESKSPVSMLNMANSYYNIGDYPNASKVYLQIWNKPEIKNYSSSIIYKLGLCAFYMLDYKTAQHYLQRALLSPREAKEKVRIFYILGKVYINKNDFPKAFTFFMNTRKIFMTNKLNLKEIEVEVNKKINYLLEEELKGDELEAVYHDYAPEFPSDIALYKHIGYLYEKGIYKKALNEIEKFQQLFPDHKRTSSLMFIKSKIDQYEKPQITIKIGAIIPQSGRFAIYGKKILRGIQLAVEEINAKTKKKVALIIKDDQGKPIVTRKVFKELASLSDMLGIIGPILSEEVLAIKDLADDYGIPVITPSATREGLPGMSRMIFRNCLTNAEQGRFLAEFALNKLCLKTFAVMHPENKYGKRLKEVFTRTVEEMGGKIVYIASYKENETDFKKQCKIINRLKPDSIFIADYPEKPVMILPQIAFYSVGNSGKHSYTILGTKGWYNPRLISEGEGYVTNSFFPSGFFKGSKDLEVVNFYQNFVAHFTDEPDDLAAQAFDTTNILFQAIEKSNLTRESVVEELFKIKDFPGVSGYSTIQPDGDSHKKLRVLTVQKKRFVEVKGNEAWLCRGAKK